MDDDFADGFLEDLREIRKGHEQLNNEFRRLCAEPCMEVANVGDSVIVATGLLCMGHPWVRNEATVLAVADANYKVRFTDYRTINGEPKVCWIHSALVVGIVRACEATP